MRIFKNDYDTNVISSLTYLELSDILTESDTEIEVIPYEYSREYFFDVPYNYADVNNKPMIELMLTFDAESTIVMHFDSGFDIYITK